MIVGVVPCAGQPQPLRLHEIERQNDLCYTQKPCILCKWPAPLFNNDLNPECVFLNDDP